MTLCGIAGTWDHDGARNSDHVDLMIAALSHRGPDGSGIWTDAGAAVAIGHRRLAILDLSAEGQQPMISRDGRFVVTFNGETYNYEDLRGELAAQGVTFRGRSDTEVLVEGFCKWGIRGTLDRMIGMFAIAVWDRLGRTLTLARDRLGEKPLYYGVAGGGLVFASELKAITALPAFRGEINTDALRSFFRYGYVPAPHCIWKGIRKLPPGTFLTLGKPLEAANAPPVVYWSARVAAAKARGEPSGETEAAQVESLERLLRKTVRRSMVSDVPLGVFLSGGIDSSLVAALAQAESDRPIRTFTIGFQETAYNEAVYAERIANHLGTDHTQLYVTPEEARAVIPRLGTMYDEPFADSSQVPTHLVARLARRHVTVALSGDGGDEVFGGYNRHIVGAKVARALGRLPRTIQRAGGSVILSVPRPFWSVLDNGFGIQPGSLRRKAHKLGGALKEADVSKLYESLVTLWPESDNPVRSPSTSGSAEQPTETLDLRDAAAEMMMRDVVSYLPDDILTKVDRASMAVGLEVRAPLLSHEVFDAAWRLPMNLKIRDGKGKLILREILARHVPPHLFERPKTGFGVPIDSWLRGPLRDWAEGLLDETRLTTEGFLDVERVRASWQEHLSGKRDRHHELWAVLMFELWLENNRVLLQDSVAREVETPA